MTPSVLFISKVRRFYEAREIFQECEHVYRFKVGMTNSIITHLAKVAEIAPLEWNFKIPSWVKGGVCERRRNRQTDIEGEERR